MGSARHKNDPLGLCKDYQLWLATHDGSTRRAVAYGWPGPVCVCVCVRRALEDLPILVDDECRIVSRLRVFLHRIVPLQTAHGMFIFGSLIG